MQHSNQMQASCSPWDASLNYRNAPLSPVIIRLHKYYVFLNKENLSCIKIQTRENKRTRGWLLTWQKIFHTTKSSPEDYF